jgi:hypothetical protein
VPQRVNIYRYPTWCHFIRLFYLTLSLLMSYICGATCQARNFNNVCIWTYVWQHWKPPLYICCTMFQHWTSAESYPVAQLCVNTLLATKVTLITDGIWFGTLRVKQLYMFWAFLANPQEFLHCMVSGSLWQMCGCVVMWFGIWWLVWCGPTSHSTAWVETELKIQSTVEVTYYNHG